MYYLLQALLYDVHILNYVVTFANLEHIMAAYWNVKEIFW